MIPLSLYFPCLSQFLLHTRHWISQTPSVLRRASCGPFGSPGGSLAMGVGIWSMHFIGMLAFNVEGLPIYYDVPLLILSIFVAVVASAVALYIVSTRQPNFTTYFLGSFTMGTAIAGMHYTAMAAMDLVHSDSLKIDQSALLASDGLAAAVIVGTLVILGIALSGSNVERALSRKTLVNEALQASLQSRDDFFSVASHELKTPLTSIKLQNDLMLRNFRSGNLDRDKFINQLEKSGKNIDRINRLVDDMLDISRMATSRLTLQKERFDLTLLVSEVIERLRPLMEQARCDVIFDDGKAVNGEWDRFRIEQVITNLLTNAAKYAPGKPISIKIMREESHVSLRVADQGKGIAPEDHDRIFKRFERAESAKDTRGLGLGLYITSEIIRMHGGEIKVLSRPNEGAEFVVLLPA